MKRDRNKFSVGAKIMAHKLVDMAFELEIPLLVGVKQKGGGYMYLEQGTRKSLQAFCNYYLTKIQQG